MASASRKKIDLPYEMLIKIAKLLVIDGFWRLGPLLKAGRRGVDAVLAPEVLKVASIYHICEHPSSFQTTRNPNGEHQEEGIHRRIFEKCLKAGNSIAIYNEGLRIVAEERDIQGGIALLKNNVPEDAESTLACGIFSMLYGDEQMAVRFLHQFDAHHYPLQSEGVRLIGEDLFQRLSMFKTARKNTYKDSFVYPSSSLIPFPDCAMSSCLRWGRLSTDTRYYDIICVNCGVWWVAKSICEIL